MLWQTSLVDRVADLGGELVLESSEDGSRLDIIIPSHAVRAGPATNAS